MRRADTVTSHPTQRTHSTHKVYNVFSNAAPRVFTSRISTAWSTPSSTGSSTPAASGPYSTDGTTPLSRRSRVDALVPVWSVDRLVTCSSPMSNDCRKQT